jgi:hypothetical protein
VYKDDTYQRGSEHNVYSETQLGQAFLTILKLHSRCFREEGRACPGPQTYGTDHQVLLSGFITLMKSNSATCEFLSESKTLLHNLGNKYLHEEII